jgi:DNA-directed RNA polymerase subunit RPC12/RpoP
MRARFVVGIAPARPERAPVAYACAGCGTIYPSKAQVAACVECERREHALVRVVPGPDACVQCLHWVVYPGADYGYACAQGRFLACRPHRPGAKPYAPRAGK